MSSTDHGTAADAGQPDLGTELDFYTFAPEALAHALADHELLRQVGRGSMGVVFEARRRSDGGRVALKVLPPSATLNERALARFLREGELMAKIRHPAIVAAHAHGQHGRVHWFVMDFVDGTTLEERVRLGPLPPRQVAAIGVEVARALQFAHERGVLHRDVKPANLMLRDDGQVVITDFGLARETGTGSMTESGTIVGTPMYMAPEQVLGDHGEVGTRADVYGLGATLHHLVTGEPPFSGPTAQSVLKAVLEADPPRPARRRPDLPPALEAIVLKAMEKEPQHRYASAEEMADDLERFLAGERVRAPRPGVLRTVRRRIARHPVAATLALGSVLVAVLVASLLEDRRLARLQERVRGAEASIAAASGLRDEQLRPLSARARTQLLLDAVRQASSVIAEDPEFAPAWLARAQARHRLQRYRDALDDLDEAARLRGVAGPEILYFRIDTLRRLPGAAVRARLIDDLDALLAGDPGPYTRALVAEHAVELVAATPEPHRGRLLGRAEDVLARLRGTDARTALARARVLELRGEVEAAERAMQQARVLFRGDPMVHRRAAEMFRRLGHPELGEEEARLARMLDPLAEPRVEAPEASPGEADPARVSALLARLEALVSGSGSERG